MRRRVYLHALHCTCMHASDMSVHVCMCVWLCTFLGTCVHVDAGVCVYIHVCMSICLCTLIPVCMCVCMYMSVYIGMCLFPLTCACVYLCVHMRAFMCMSVCFCLSYAQTAHSFPSPACDLVS